MRSLRLPKTRVRNWSTGPWNLSRNGGNRNKVTPAGKVSSPPGPAVVAHFTIDAGALPVRGRRTLGLLADKRQWIHMPAVLQHLEVHMRTGGAASGAHQRNGLAAAHAIAHGHQRSLVVRVAR